MCLLECQLISYSIIIIGGCKDVTSFNTLSCVAE